MAKFSRENLAKFAFREGFSHFSLDSFDRRFLLSFQTRRFSIEIVFCWSRVCRFTYRHCQHFTYKRRYLLFAPHPTPSCIHRSFNTGDLCSVATFNIRSTRNVNMAPPTPPHPTPPHPTPSCIHRSNNTRDPCSVATYNVRSTRNVNMAPPTPPHPTPSCIHRSKTPEIPAASQHITYEVQGTLTCPPHSTPPHHDLRTHANKNVRFTSTVFGSLAYTCTYAYTYTYAWTFTYTYTYTYNYI